jgi:alpha-D-xyloside xylohydrolase
LNPDGKANPIPELLNGIRPVTLIPKICGGDARQGIRLNLWINPYVSKDAPFYKQIAPITGSHTVWVGEVPDFSIPEARKFSLVN